MDHTMIDADELADNQAQGTDPAATERSAIAALAHRQDESLEKRMGELSEMIRSWDWRAHSQETQVEYLPPAPAPPPPVPPYEIGQKVFGDEFVSLGDTTADPASLPFEPQHAPTPPEGQPAVRTRSHAAAPRQWSALSWCVAFLALAVVGLVVVGLTQFGPTSHPHSAAPTTPVRHRGALVPLAARFASIAKPAEAANVEAAKGLGQLATPPAPALVAPLVAANGLALAQFDRSLSYIRWPTSLKSADTALSAALYETIVHIDTLHAVPASAIGPWLTSYEANVAAVEAAVNQLGAHLGLPAAS